MYPFPIINTSVYPYQTVTMCLFHPTVPHLCPTRIYTLTSPPSLSGSTSIATNLVATHRYLTLFNPIVSCCDLPYSILRYPYIHTLTESYSWPFTVVDHIKNWKVKCWERPFKICVTRTSSLSNIPEGTIWHDFNCNRFIKTCNVFNTFITFPSMYVNVNKSTST